MPVSLLLIEDNEDILANLYAYLEPLGYELDCARHGRAGLDMAVRGCFDCIVLDIMLPGLDGVSLCRMLREEHRSAVPVLMLTARDTVADRVRGLEAGADDYLVKPFALKELEARNPASVEVCTLFFKPGSYRKTLPIKYRAMEIGNEFIVGYGLDYDQLGRSLKDIYVVTE